MSENYAGRAPRRLAAGEGRAPSAAGVIATFPVMRRIMVRAKIHRATITNADLHYEGSLTIDRDLLDAADLKVYEKVAVVNVNNGARFETYVIEGVRGSGSIQLNGAAARLGAVGDLVIIMAFGEFEEQELTDDFEPIKVFVDSHNRIKKVIGG
jgi:aspartate 1-decarboxylase